MTRSSTRRRSLAAPGLRLGLALVLSLIAASSAHAARPTPLRFRAAEETRSARPLATSPFDASWVGCPLPNVNGTIFSTLLFDGKVVAAGQASSFGTTPTRNIATWDGVSWQALGDGLSHPTYSLVNYGGRLVAAGFGPISGNTGPTIHDWNGASWTPLGTATGDVNAMAVIGSDLYVGGTFTSIDGVPASRLARWDGESWNAVGAGFAAGSTVRAMAVRGTTLIIGGTIAAYQGIAQWDGVALTQVGAGLQNGTAAGVVNALVSDGSTVYAGGTFNSSGGLPVTRVAVWKGANWSGLAGATVTSNALALYGGTPMATVLDAGVRRPQLWDGSVWQPFNHADVDPLGYALDGTTLYAGGPSSGNAGATPTTLQGFSSFDGATWSPVQQAWTPDMLGVNGTAYSAQEWHGDLFVGGVFAYVGTGTKYLSSPGVARWNGSEWSAVGTGGQYFFFTVWNDSLVASVDRSARVWNGSAWRNLRADQSGSFTFDTFGFGLAPYQGSLCVFGPTYAAPNDVPLYGVGRWNGSDWEAVGHGITDPNGFAQAGVEWGAYLVIGGQFNSADNRPVRNLAYWDGVAYHDLGGGVDGLAYTLAVEGGDLLVGGFFTEAGSVPVHGAARWDGSEWHAMGSRAVGVEKFRSHAGTLYGVGRFLNDADQEIDAVARWTGTEWQLLGSGASGGVYDLEFYGDDLYIAGAFAAANGHASRSFAKLPNVSTVGVDPPAPHGTRLALALSPNPSRGRVRLSVTLPVAGRARLAIHDVSGREVARLLDGEHAAGSFSLAWDASVSPGLYFATLSVAGERVSTRLVRFE